MAARLQGVARRNGIVIGALTRELSGDGFVYEDMGAHELKGISGLVRTWGVTGLRDDRARGTDQDETDGAASVPELVGRDEETGLLRRAWQSTTDEGRGQVVVISGEAGIGKSVLIDGLRAEVRAEGLPRLTMRCSPYHTNSALYPVVEHFKRLARWQPKDSTETRLEKLETCLEHYNQPLVETVPLLAVLLSLQLPEDRYPPLTMTPQQQKQLTQDAIIGITMEVAESRPFLQLWEDLHWADPSTLELLGLLIDQAPTVSLLMVLTARPEFVPPWPARSHVTPIALNRLERPHAEALVVRIADMKPLPDEVIDHIATKTDGVPLYVEELTKTILASDILHDTGECFELTGPLSSLSIPDTLQESLMARLDRLPQVRELAQLGSVLGREFAYEMISGLSTSGESVLREGLGQLVNAELLYQRGRPPRARYIFKHALIQDAAYGSLLKRTRQQYHLQAAELFETRFPETVDAHPELMARHYTEAGNVERAIDYWCRAGERARAQSANLEAIVYFTNGIEALGKLPGGDDRLRQELALQVSLGHANIVAMGHGALGAETAYARALELCEQIGDAPELAATLFGLWRFYVVTKTLNETNDVAMRLHRIAKEKQQTELQVVSDYALGYTALCKGDLEKAKANLSEGIARYSPEQRSEAIYRTAQDPGVACRAYLGMTEWLLGYPEVAQNRIEQSIELAEELNDTFSLAYALCFSGAIVAEVSGIDTGEVVERGLQIATDGGFALWIAFAEVQRNSRVFNDTKSETTLLALAESVKAIPQMGVHINTPYFATLLAQGYQQVGRIDEGLKILEDAFSSLDARGEYWWHAEVLRQKGELLLSLSTDNVREAEKLFELALDISQQQKAKSLELRAATSLARLWSSQGKEENARNLLGGCLTWFTEGADTADHKEARQLLQILK